MLLYMIRHGESEANISGVVGGCRSIIGLTEKGIEDAKAAGKKILGIKFDKVYASTLKRAIQTCEAALPGCEPVLDEKLREFDTGSIDGLPISYCQEKFGEVYEQANKNHDCSVFGGETRHDHIARVKKFLEILEKEPYDKVAVFTHEGTMRRVYEIVTDCDGCTEKRCRNGAVCIFEYDGERWSLKTWEL